MVSAKSNDQCPIQFRKAQFALLIVAFFIQTASVAQDIVDQDFLELNSGDTLRGTVQHIDERGVSPKFHKKIRLTDAKGKKKKFHRTDVKSFSADRQVYESFWLKQSSDRITLDNPRYDITSRGGQQYFLKRISQGILSHYQLEWLEQGESALMSMDLLKKENDSFLIRATQGIFGLKKKVLEGYFANCPLLRKQIEERQIKDVLEVVALYNAHCGGG